MPRICHFRADSRWIKARIFVGVLFHLPYQKSSLVILNKMRQARFDSLMVKQGLTSNACYKLSFKKMMWFSLTWLLQTSVEEWDEFNQISSPGIGGILFFEHSHFVLSWKRMKNLDHPRNISLNLQQYTILFLLISKNILVDLNKTKIVTICADSNKTNVFV